MFTATVNKIKTIIDTEVNETLSKFVCSFLLS
jgi:hypothetical protein